MRGHRNDQVLLRMAQARHRTTGARAPQKTAEPTLKIYARIEGETTTEIDFSPSRLTYGNAAKLRGELDALISYARESRDYISEWIDATMADRVKNDRKG